MREFTWLEGLFYMLSRFRYPGKDFQISFPQVAPNMAAHRTGPAVTWAGHATVLATLGGESFLFDPFFSDRASPVPFLGPRRFRKPAFAVEDLPDNLVAVFISHNHYDHMDKASIRAIARRFPDVMFCVPLGVRRWFARNGLERRCREYNWWNFMRVGGLATTFVPAKHWSGRGLFDASTTLWGGWVVQGADKTVYFSGDTGYCEYFSEIGREFPQIDLAILPIGSYKPVEMMRPHHCSPAEAVAIMRDVGASQAIGVHYGCLPSRVEPCAPRAAVRAAADAFIIGDRFLTPLEGETVLLPAAGGG
jgi:L-ascorbate metabolism protein UlaG (beta-lactamase superfamily)